jgi:hypothetical protein
LGMNQINQHGFVKMKVPVNTVLVIKGFFFQSDYLPPVNPQSKVYVISIGLPRIPQRSKFWCTFFARDFTHSIL